jgi:hypothetical protein
VAQAQIDPRRCRHRLGAAVGEEGRMRPAESFVSPLRKVAHPRYNHRQRWRLSAWFK